MRFFRSIICILVVAGVILFFTTDFFRTKRGAFFRYFNQIPEALKVIETDKYDSYNQMMSTFFLKL